MQLGSVLKPKFNFKDYEPFTQNDLSDIALDFDAIKSARWMTYEAKGKRVDLIQLGVEPTSAFIMTLKSDSKLTNFQPQQVYSGETIHKILMDHSTKGELAFEDEKSNDIRSVVLLIGQTEEAAE